MEGTVFISYILSYAELLPSALSRGRREYTALPSLVRSAILTGDRSNAMLIRNRTSSARGPSNDDPCMAQTRPIQMAQITLRATSGVCPDGTG